MALSTFSHYSFCVSLVGFVSISTRCLQISEKVSFNIASEASYVYNLSGQGKTVLPDRSQDKNW